MLLIKADSLSPLIKMELKRLFCKTNLYDLLNWLMRYLFENETIISMLPLSAGSI